MRRRYREPAAWMIAILLYVLSLRLLPDPIEGWAFVIGLLLSMALASWVVRKFCNRY